MTQQFEDYLNDKVNDPLREARILRYRLNLKNQMTTPEGRKFVYGILGLCDVATNANCIDTNQTFFKLGMQNIGQLLQLELNTECPELYFTMLKEAKDDDDRDRREHERSTSSE